MNTVKLGHHILFSELWGLIRNGIEVEFHGFKVFATWHNLREKSLIEAINK